MLKLRKVYAAAFGVCAALAVCAPAANADFVPGFDGGWNLGPIGNNPATAVGSCGTPTGAEAQGGTGGTAQQACLGTGYSYVGWSVGQIASVIGPAGTGPGGNMVVSAGNGVAGG